MQERFQGRSISSAAFLWGPCIPLLHYNLSSLTGATPGAIPSDLLNSNTNDEQ